MGQLTPEQYKKLEELRKEYGNKFADDVEAKWEAESVEQPQTFSPVVKPAVSETGEPQPAHGIIGLQEETITEPPPVSFDRLTEDEFEDKLEDQASRLIAGYQHGLRGSYSKEDAVELARRDIEKAARPRDPSGHTVLMPAKIRDDMGAWGVFKESLKSVPMDTKEDYKNRVEARTEYLRIKKLEELERQKSLDLITKEIHKERGITDGNLRDLSIDEAQAIHEEAEDRYANILLQNKPPNDASQEEVEEWHDFIERRSPDLYREETDYWERIDGWEGIWKGTKQMLWSHTDYRTGVQYESVPVQALNVIFGTEAVGVGQLITKGLTYDVDNNGDPIDTSDWAYQIEQWMPDAYKEQGFLFPLGEGTVQDRVRFAGQTLQMGGMLGIMPRPFQALAVEDPEAERTALRSGDIMKDFALANYQRRFLGDDAALLPLYYGKLQEEGDPRIALAAGLIGELAIPFGVAYKTAKLGFLGLTKGTEIAATAAGATKVAEAAKFAGMDPKLAIAQHEAREAARGLSAEPVLDEIKDVNRITSLTADHIADEIVGPLTARKRIEDAKIANAKEAPDLSDLTGSVLHDAQRVHKGNAFAVHATLNKWAAKMEKGIAAGEVSDDVAKAYELAKISLYRTSKTHDYYGRHGVWRMVRNAAKETLLNRTPVNADMIMATRSVAVSEKAFDAHADEVAEYVNGMIQPKFSSREEIGEVFVDKYTAKGPYIETTIGPRTLRSNEAFVTVDELPTTSATARALGYHAVELRPQDRVPKGTVINSMIEHTVKGDVINHQTIFVKSDGTLLNTDTQIGKILGKINKAEPEPLTVREYQEIADLMSSDKWLDTITDSVQFSTAGQAYKAMQTPVSRRASSALFETWRKWRPRDWRVTKDINLVKKISGRALRQKIRDQYPTLVVDQTSKTPLHVAQGLDRINNKIKTVFNAMTEDIDKALKEVELNKIYKEELDELDARIQSIHEYEGMEDMPLIYEMSQKEVKYDSINVMDLLMRDALEHGRLPGMRGGAKEIRLLAWRGLLTNYFGNSLSPYVKELDSNIKRWFDLDIEAGVLDGIPAPTMENFISLVNKIKTEDTAIAKNLHEMGARRLTHHFFLKFKSDKIGIADHYVGAVFAWLADQKVNRLVYDELEELAKHHQEWAISFNRLEDTSTSKLADDVAKLVRERLKDADEEVLVNIGKAQDGEITRINEQNHKQLIEWVERIKLLKEETTKIKTEMLPQNAKVAVRQDPIDTPLIVGDVFKESAPTIKDYLKTRAQRIKEIDNEIGVLKEKIKDLKVLRARPAPTTDDLVAQVTEAVMGELISVSMSFKSEQRLGLVEQMFRNMIVRGDAYAKLAAVNAIKGAVGQQLAPRVVRSRMRSLGIDDKVIIQSKATRIAAEDELIRLGGGSTEELRAMSEKLTEAESMAIYGERGPRFGASRKAEEAKLTLAEVGSQVIKDMLIDAIAGDAHKQARAQLNMLGLTSKTKISSKAIGEFNLVNFPSVEQTSFLYGQDYADVVRNISRAMDDGAFIESLEKLHLHQNFKGVDYFLKVVDHTVDYLRRIGTTGLLSGLFVPNAMYHTRNVMSMPAIGYVTVGTENTIKALGLGRHNTLAGGWAKVRNSYSPDQVVFVQKGTGIAWTRRMIETAIAENPVTSKHAFQFGGSEITELTRLAKVEADGVPSGIFKRFFRNFNPAGDPVFNRLATQTDNYFRENLFVHALMDGKSVEVASDLSKNVLLDYGKVPGVARDLLRSFMRIIAFQWMMSSEVLKVMRDNPAKLGKMWLTQRNAKRVVDRHYIEKDWYLSRMYMHMGEVHDKHHRTTIYGIENPALESFITIADIFASGAAATVNAMNMLVPNVDFGVPGVGEQLAKTAKGLVMSPEIELFASMNQNKGRATKRVPDNYILMANAAGVEDEFFKTYGIIPMDISERRGGEPTYRGRQFKFATEADYKRFIMSVYIAHYSGLGRLVGSETPRMLKALRLTPPGYDGKRFHEPDMNSAALFFGTETPIKNDDEVIRKTWALKAILRELENIEMPEE